MRIVSEREDPGLLLQKHFAGRTPNFRIKNVFPVVETPTVTGLAGKWVHPQKVIRKAGPLQSAPSRAGNILWSFGTILLTYILNTPILYPENLLSICVPTDCIQSSIEDSFCNSIPSDGT